MGNEGPQIAVIGMGPRSLGALEALASYAKDGAASLQVDCFDPFPAYGAGPNFDPDEPDLCLLNIPMRDIDLPPPDFLKCSQFSDWIAEAYDPDAFPTRPDLGRYLELRYNALNASGRLRISHFGETVTALKQDEGRWKLLSAGEWHGPYAEVLLTVGQPSVQPDDQLAEWQQHVKTSSGVLAQAYPAKDLRAQAAEWAGRTVAIRGLALSAFDVLRVLTTAQGGRFENGSYLRSGKEPSRILPFSLDGHPPFPKPETKALDARFDPTLEETEVFAQSIAAAATGSPDAAQRVLSDALKPAVCRILTELDAGVPTDSVSDWIETEWSAPGSQEAQQDPLDVLLSGIAMAEGTATPSIGYTVGQVWRKWQNALRSGYNPAETARDTANKIVAFDEGLKRYSYGPPVSSSRELAALVDAGIVDLAYAADPNIEVIDAGWRLEAENSSVDANIMIDAVLPSPKVSNLRAPLLVGLIADDRLRSVSKELAGHTAADGTLLGDGGYRSVGLCLLGRLALGSVIAADSLHDCFGEASRRWAQGVVDRIASPADD